VGRAGRSEASGQRSAGRQVTGEQFAWNIHYAGPDGKFGRTDIKLLDLQSNPLGLDRDRSCREGRRHDAQPALPAGEQADHRQAQEQGRHPQLRRARVPREAGRHPRPHDSDLVRPHVTTAEMRTRTGKPEFQYEIACAQLCGLGHARMRGFVTVQTADEFQKWLDEKVKEQSAPDPFK
jgi:cytochrome c oxidase subunit 2